MSKLKKKLLALIEEYREAAIAASWVGSLPVEYHTLTKENLNNKEEELLIFIEKEL